MNSGWWLCSCPDHELSTTLLLSGLQPSQESTLIPSLLLYLSPSDVKHSLKINLVNSKLSGIFYVADYTLIHCRIDKLLLGELHCRSSTCKLSFCNSLVLQVLKNFVNGDFSTPKCLKGLTVELLESEFFLVGRLIQCLNPWSSCWPTLLLYKKNGSAFRQTASSGTWHTWWSRLVKRRTFFVLTHYRWLPLCIWLSILKIDGSQLFTIDNTCSSSQTKFKLRC